MTATLNFTESQALAVLRAFLISILPAGFEVVEGLDNRVPEPAGTDFAVLIPMHRERTETNIDTLDPTGLILTVLQPVLLTLQIEIHGPSSPDNAQVITTLYRDDFAVQFFQASGLDIGPIHADDPRQVPFQNQEQQWEKRWIITAILQLNQSVTVPAQSALEFEVEPLVPVDVIPIQ